MDAMSFIAEPGMPVCVERFLNTIRMLKYSAWNAFPNRHYFGMISVERVEHGWRVGFAPVGGGGERVTVTDYALGDEERLAFDVARKMHPQLICACSSPNTCFEGACPVRPAS
jgi:hypothetical protein